LHLLGIDFEDWYHPQLVAPFVSEEKKTPTMFRGLDKILDLLRKNDSKATFFLVGELLEANPEISDKILSGGHELGFHTMRHTRLDSPNFKSTFKQELQQFGEITSKKVLGFRAPTFSLNETSSWAIDELVGAGYKYDSSVIPAKTSMYGLPSAEKSPYRITSFSLDRNDSNGTLIEFPLLVTKFLGKTVPAAGGFYLRILPFGVIKNAIKSYEKQNMPASLYIHSWELTPEHIPKIRLPRKNHFITFHNIEKTFSKMNDLLQEFEFSTFESYLPKMSSK
jgi:polysaccharide deacetylase family protein (PEP-CTERM system associated)